MTPNQKLSYSVEDAVALTSLSRSRIYQAIAAKELATFKAGRRRMVSRKALEDFITKLERLSAKGAA